MNYKRIYKELITNARSRQLPETVYTEQHHVKPKCKGGSDGKKNLVRLTYREHILAHRLLYRMHPRTKELAYAFHMMVKGTNGYEVKNRYILAEAKEAYIRARTGSVHSEATKRKISKSNTGKHGTMNGRKMSTETKEKMRQAKLGKKRSQEAKDAISAGKKAQMSADGYEHHRTGTKHSKTTRKRMSISRKMRD
jgi:hypothetical protein